MGAFAGYNMPLFYPLGVKGEHLHTREAAGLFDISHMMHVEISGAGAQDCISRLCPYDPEGQEQGEAKYTFLLNEKAGIIDDLIVTRLGGDRFLIVANAGCAEKDLAHIQDVSGAFDVSVNVIPRAFVALQGPKAEAVLEDAGLGVSDLSFMEGREPKDGWFVSRTGYTGEDGFEIAAPDAELTEFAQTLTADERVEWIGLGARDSLRLEAGLSLYGQDLDEDTTPMEAGLTWAIPKDLRNGGSFIGADALAEKVTEGRQRRRVGLLPDGRPVRAGADLINEDGNVIGSVTSGGFGPSLEGPMALGLVAVDHGDAPIYADLRGKKVAMTPTGLPFIPHNYKR